MAQNPHELRAIDVLVETVGIEPTTFRLSRGRSTTELRPEETYTPASPAGMRERGRSGQRDLAGDIAELASTSNIVCTVLMSGSAGPWGFSFLVEWIAGGRGRDGAG